MLPVELLYELPSVTFGLVTCPFLFFLLSLSLPQMTVEVTRCSSMTVGMCRQTILCRKRLLCLTITGFYLKYTAPRCIKTYSPCSLHWSSAIILTERNRDISYSFIFNVLHMGAESRCAYVVMLRLKN